MHNILTERTTSVIRLYIYTCSSIDDWRSLVRRDDVLIGEFAFNIFVHAEGLKAR